MSSELIELADRYASVRARLAAACAEAGRDVSQVRLIAVSKTHPVDKITALASLLGHRCFGENYAQELASKRRVLNESGPEGQAIQMSYIGTLQSNKIALLVSAADEIQTLCDARHARLIARAAAEQKRTPYPVWINVNAAGEPSKSGVTLGEAEVLADTIAREHPELAVQGLMAIPPPLEALGTDAEAPSPPPLYRELASVARRVGQGGLSLGMSDDLRLAVLAGSTCIRIGTAIFGTR